MAATENYRLPEYDPGFAANASRIEEMQEKS